MHSENGRRWGWRSVYKPDHVGLGGQSEEFEFHSERKRTSSKKFLLIFSSLCYKILKLIKKSTETIIKKETKPNTLSIQLKTFQTPDSFGSLVPLNLLLQIILREILDIIVLSINNPIYLRNKGSFSAYLSLFSIRYFEMFIEVQFIVETLLYQEVIFKNLLLN